MPSDLFKEIGQSIDDAREERVKELRKFHIGDVVYPLLQRWEPLVWGTVKDVSPATRKITVDIAGTEKQFDPEDLVLTSPELKAPNQYNEERQKELEKIGDKVDKAFKASRSLRLASVLEADKDYVHDPEHKKKPEGGGWHETEKGWSRKKGDGQKEQKPAEQQVSPEISKLKGLASSGNRGDRLAVARHDKATPEILDKLSRDEFFDVRRAVAENFGTSPETLDRMIGEDTDGSPIKIAVAGNPQASPQTLDKLAGNDNYLVRLGVAGNSKASPSALMKLGRDKVRNVADAAKENWKKHHQEFYKEHDQALEAAKGNVVKQKEIISEYLDAPALPAEAFRKFDKIMSDKNMDANSKKDRDLMQKFYAHPDQDPEELETVYEGVVDSMVSEEEYPWRDFDQNVLLKTIHDNPACFSSVKEKIGKVMTARNPKMAPDVLADLSQDEAGEVRFLVAGNKKTPSSVLTMMAAGEGGSPLQQGIRARAKSTLDQLKKKKTPSSQLKKAAAAGDDASLKALKDRKKLRKDFCMIELEDEETYEQMKGYKKAIGEKQGHGRSPEQVKQDFVKNMDPSKYGSPEAFQAAKKRIQEMPVKKFDALLGIIYNKDEEETEE
ncbi:MAG: hypothetical protein J6Y62_02090 [Clostridia bacterium]|nr:hypothetical protein [Clostridia bacterium]